RNSVSIAMTRQTLVIKCPLSHAGCTDSAFRQEWVIRTPQAADDSQHLAVRGGSWASRSVQMATDAAAAECWTAALRILAGIPCRVQPSAGGPPSKDPGGRHGNSPERQARPKPGVDGVARIDRGRET